MRCKGLNYLLLALKTQGSILEVKKTREWVLPSLGPLRKKQPAADTLLFLSVCSQL